MVRVTTIAALAALAALTACSSTNALPQAASAACRPHTPQSPASLLPGVTTAPEVATAARLGLWPRDGPSIRVCGPVRTGFARCQAWRRTDVRGDVGANTPGGYAPSDLQTAYGLTSYSNNAGTGVTIAVVDAYDDPNAAADLNVYRAKFGLPPCTTANGCFSEQKYTSQTNPGWAGEEAVDVDMVSAICPNCKILLVEAASSGIADLSTAERYATTHADDVSNSWSGNEGTKTYDGAYTSSCGAITAATGDAGHNATAQWPAILPNVIGVGGTKLASISPRVESAWAGSGSGCSRIYAKPAFQIAPSTGCSMRAQSDVSAVADPRTGVAVYDTFGQSGWQVFGGTSVAAPIVASIFALAGDAPAGPLQNLYAHAAAFDDVTSGSTGGCGAPLCVAGPGWDGPTGLGAPQGIAGF